MWSTSVLAAWTRADTHNFIIYSNGDRVGLEQFANDVERFDALLRLRFGVGRDEAPKRLTIYVVSSQSDVGAVLDGRPEFVAGFYIPETETSFAVVHRGKKDDLFDLSGQEVLFHEYAHHFMFRHFTTAYPAWFTEGFAEFVATATIAPDGHWTLGKPARYRTRDLVTDSPLPVEKLLDSKISKLRGGEIFQFYARSWLLAHMLYTQPQYAGKLSQYAQLVTNGTPSLEAAKTAFGDLKALDKTLQSYVSAKMQFISSSRAIAIDGPVTVTQLDPLQSQLVELRLKRRTGGQVLQARDTLRTLTAQNPQNAELWSELAYAELAVAGKAAAKAEREKDEADRKAKEKEKEKTKGAVKDKAKGGEDDEIVVTAIKDDDTIAAHAADSAAETAADRALAVDPTNVIANNVKGEVATWRLKQSGDASAAHWQAARSWYRKASNADSDDALSALGWFMSFKRQGKVPPSGAVQGLEGAFQRAPEAEDLRSRLAFDLARREQYDAAIELMKVIAYSPHARPLSRAMLKKLQDMKADADAAKGNEKPAAAEPKPAQAAPKPAS
jgi:hypothetical protein